MTEIGEHPWLQEEAPGRTGHLLEFTLGDKTYAIDIVRIRTIVDGGELRPTTVSPAFVRGVIALNGIQVLVLDMGVLYGFAPGEINERSNVIVVETSLGQDTYLMGIAADAIVNAPDGPDIGTLGEGQTEHGCAPPQRTVPLSGRELPEKRIQSSPCFETSYIPTEDTYLP